ncbi:ABC transporter [Saccharobesus litoralis]|uniref:ABC transporter n=1 Tax=Saccharobesus litoralis TaxID=2172099 RepID=A0A2S0VR01_9ALTE|nr:ATP-binding cassette domain-containing protein [Saccharobesus litoralis]AWB66641.1 ABC transporter [Saccharobesus litoralis]
MLIQQLETKNLSIGYWDLKREAWLVFGDNNSGKHLLFDNLIDFLKQQQPAIERVACVNFAEQERLVLRELERDESDITDIITPGTLVEQMLSEIEPQSTIYLPIAKQLGLENKLTLGFRCLSTGETRKLLLARALLAQPELLLVEDILDGIDTDTRECILTVLKTFTQGQRQLIMLVDRLADIPAFITHYALFSEGELTLAATKKQVEQDNLWLKLQLNKPAKPLPDTLYERPALNSDEPIFSLCNGRVSYGDNVVFSGLNWQIKQGEHWRILGRNGAGKSTLLKLVTGEHPQCYSNQIRQFGFQRGSGESIWDIKQHYGLVSAELHLNYRVTVNALTVVVSGFFDSIGVYQAVNQSQKNQALIWLDWFCIGHLANLPFQSLSYGQQRLVLIARALVKAPRLLIFDEPMQGLDEANCQLVISAINRLIASKACQLLYVSHREEPELQPVFKTLKLPIE